MVFILRKSLPVAGSSARIGPQLTDEEYLSRCKWFERDKIFTHYAVGIWKKILHVKRSSARIGSQLTDEEYLSRCKWFERDQICTIYSVYIKKKILHVSLIHVIVKTGGITTSHAVHAFSPLPPAVFF